MECSKANGLSDHYWLSSFSFSKLSSSISFLSFQCLYIDASIAPEILCQTENIAPGTVANAISLNDDWANDDASPEFCIPISIDKAFVLFTFILNNFAIPKPNKYPNRLCIITTTIIIAPHVFILETLCETTDAIIKHIPIVDINGNNGVIFDVNLLKKLNISPE